MKRTSKPAPKQPTEPKAPTLQELIRLDEQARIQACNEELQQLFRKYNVELYAVPMLRALPVK